MIGVQYSLPCGRDLAGSHHRISTCHFRLPGAVWCSDQSPQSEVPARYTEGIMFSEHNLGDFWIASNGGFLENVDCLTRQTVTENIMHLILMI